MKTKKLLSILLSAALMFTLLPMTAQTAYAAAPKVKITWNANGGKIGTAKTKTISYTKGKKIGKLPATPKYTGYTFKGWYTKKSAGTKITKNTKATKKATYYAQWTAKKYMLTFNANGGSVTPASKKVTYKKGYGTLPTPKRDGYSFNGWYTAKSGGTKVSATTAMAAKDVTVYAQWKKALSADEKELVGEYYYWENRDKTDLSKLYPDWENGNWIYDENSLIRVMFINQYSFKADGTYVYGSYLNSSSVNTHRFWFEKGNWAITSSGTVLFTNRIVSINNRKVPSSSVKEKEYPDMNFYYFITTKDLPPDGALKGILTSERSLEAAKTGTSFHIKK